MIPLRILGLLMMAIQAGLLWVSMGYLPVSGLAIFIAVLGCLPPLGVAWERRRRYLADGAVVLVYFLIWWLYLQSAERRSHQYEPNVTLAATLALMMLQAIRFYWRDPSGLGLMFPFLGILSLACAADVYLSNDWRQSVYFVGAMAYGLLVALYYVLLAPARDATRQSFRRFRLVTLALCFAASLGLASGTAWTLNHSDRVIGPWLMRVMASVPNVVPGNSVRVRLGDMANYDRNQADRIALQIIATDSPDYLRGQAYADYRDATWAALPDEPGIAPWRGAPPDAYRRASPDENLFRIAGGGEVARAMTIYPSPDIRRAMFTPESTGWVAQTVDGLLANDAGIVQAQRDLDGRPYRAFSVPTPAPEPLDEGSRDRHTRLPEALAARIRELSDGVCAGKESTLAKASAVVQYFTANYEYRLDFDVEPTQDPLEHFLFATPRPGAHCEYFATGATMLLRAAGVPARYVTGIVVWEQNAYADYWIARNRDAHAWCEAWDPELGWFIVEATPASGLPEAARNTNGNLWRDFWNTIAFTARRAVSALSSGAWRLAVAALGPALAGLFVFLKDSWPQWLPVLLAAGIVAVGWRFRRRRRTHSGAVQGGELERRLVQQLARMDRHVRKTLRLTRVEHCTLHAFARAIEAAGCEGDPARIAGWYRAWAETRYRSRPDPDRVGLLEEELADLARGAKRARE